jgi:signal transduction histidine kinase
MGKTDELVELLARARAGDASSLSELLEKYGQAAHIALRRLSARGLRARIDNRRLESAVCLLLERLVLLDQLDTRVADEVKAPSMQMHGDSLVAQNNLERRLADDALRVYAERLQILTRRLLEIQEEERRHLARELHDEIGQVLSTLNLNLQVALGGCDAAVRPRMEESIAIVGQAIQQVRNLSLELRPSMLDDLGLISTLRWVVNRQAERAGFVLHFDDQSTGGRLPSNVETAGYRVVQEALTNVIRHARAQQVWLSIEQRQDEVRLEIRDDGIGFDVARARELAVRGASFGILGMQERVELLGGTIEIQSQPTQGTTIHVSFPINM